MPREALITGGARGIGFAIAEALLASGYRVTVTGLTDDEVNNVPQHPDLKALRVDVTDDGGVADAVSSLDGIDALVNCAGTIARGGAEFTISTFKAVAESGVKRNIPGPCGKALAANGDRGWGDGGRDASGAGGTGAAGRA